MTGKPSVDRPWMKYYPEPLRKIQIPQCTVKEYLKRNCPGEDVAAMEFYGTEISWKTVFEQSEAVARSLKALGFKKGDQIPVFSFLLCQSFLISFGSRADWCIITLP